MPSPAIVAADAIAPHRLHAAFTAAFADYLLGPFQVPLAQWPQFLGRQAIDLAESRAAVVDGDPVAFCLVAPRPECASWRLGTMGALPAARGTGTAVRLLEDFLGRARAAGVASVELECFVQNRRALRLYEKHGFTTTDVLHGYRRAAGAPPRAAQDASPVPLHDAFDWLEACREAGCALPLQATPRSLRNLVVPLQALRHGQAQVVYSLAPDGALHLNSLVDREPAQRDAEALVSALLATHPDRTVHVPQLQRHAVGGAALERLGFERLPLHQAWMHAPA